MLFRKKPECRTYDKAQQRPMIRSSICTGEKTAGFQNIQTGKFTEVMLIRTPEDLAEFRRLYQLGAEEIPTAY